MQLLFVVTASAASGEVIWANPPENHGKIKRSDDDTDQDYNYTVNGRGDTNPPDWESVEVGVPL